MDEQFQSILRQVNEECRQQEEAKGRWYPPTGEYVCLFGETDTRINSTREKKTYPLWSWKVTILSEGEYHQKVFEYSINGLGFGWGILKAVARLITGAEPPSDSQALHEIVSQLSGKVGVLRVAPNRKNPDYHDVTLLELVEEEDTESDAQEETSDEG